MKRIYILLCLIGILSCQDKVICPAFQSTYILDDSTRNAYFSYVWQLDETTRSQYLAQQQGPETSNTSIDSLAPAVTSQPKADYYAYAGENNVPWRIPERTKYGIVKPVFMPIKKYRMRTAPMENLLGPDPVPSTTNFVAFDTDSLLTDSLGIASLDSVNVHPLVAKEDTKKETRFLFGYDPSDNFNVEQEYYNKYFSSKLIDNRPEPQPQPAILDSASTDSVGAKKPFLKGLFGKKDKKQPADSLTSQPDPLIDSTEEESGNG